MVTFNSVSLPLMTAPIERDGARPTLSKTESELIGCNVAEIFAGNNWVMERIERVSESNSSEIVMDAELRLGEDKVSLNLTVLPLLDAERERIGVMLMMEDITSEKRVKATMSRYMDPAIADQLLASDQDMLGSWDRKLMPKVEAFKPDFIIVSAGFDSRMDDLLGCFNVTDDAFRRMTRTVMDMADHYCDGRVVSLLEGGYNVDGLALATAAHLETLLDHR